MRINPLPLVLHLFTLLFVGLKLTNAIAWSWWLVLLPSYGPFTVGVVLLSIGAAIRQWTLWRATPQERARILAVEMFEELAAAVQARRA